MSSDTIRYEKTLPTEPLYRMRISITKDKEGSKDCPIPMFTRTLFSSPFLSLFPPVSISICFFKHLLTQICDLQTFNNYTGLQGAVGNLISTFWGKGRGGVSEYKIVKDGFPDGRDGGEGLRMEGQKSSSILEL